MGYEFNEVSDAKVLAIISPKNEVTIILDKTIPKEYIPGVENGLKLVRKGGIISGFPINDFKATLIDGAFATFIRPVICIEVTSLLFWNLDECKKKTTKTRRFIRGSVNNTLKLTRMYNHNSNEIWHQQAKNDIIFLIH